MEILIKALQFLLSLSLLVLLHEFGHFFFAKLFKTRVEKFYLFFDPWFSIFKYKKGETEYGIGWLPLGGYVKISGMIDESLDLEQMKQPAQPYEFRSKPTWQRLLIMLGGVTVNFLLALAIYVGILFTWGEEYLPTKNVTYGIAVDSVAYNAGFRNGDKILTVDYKEVENFFKIVPTIVLEEAKTVQVIRDGKLINIALPENLNYTLIRKKDFFTVRIPYIVGDVVKNTAAEKAGLKPGDKVVAVNDSQVIFVDQIKPIVQANKNKNITLTIEQNGVLKKIDITVPETGLLGVVLDGNISKYFQLKHNDYGFFASIPAGISMGFNTLSNYVKQFKLIFSKETKGYESLGGFITMGNLFSGVWDWESFWALTALLSIVLAFMNILPIPALDGGHVLFLLYEMVTGRKPSDKFLEYAQITGIVILFSLIIYANLNDIIRLFTH